MSHSIQSAMERRELTEEEAYFILRFAGALGYDRPIARPTKAAAVDWRLGVSRPPHLGPRSVALECQCKPDAGLDFQTSYDFQLGRSASNR
jgi:hypothetical protein